MRLLLDTHVLLWWLRDNPRLGPKARMLIANSANEIMISVASFWEVSIKARIGKLDMLGTDAWREAVEEGFVVLDVLQDHLALLETLPRVAGHNDPFDHLLIAQAKAENAVLLSGDRHMDGYGVKIMGVA